MPEVPPPPLAPDGLPPAPGTPLREAALALLREHDPRRKAAATRALAQAWRAAPAQHPVDPAARLAEPDDLPGRPLRPRLVPPKEVPARSPFTVAGRAGLLHAIAHIEFNAINLALDAVWRFPDLPPAYYADWMRVADEEALHFQLLEAHLADLAHAYGDFDAHDGLWTMARRTAHDPMARMGLVPRTLEARGLDATPALQAKLARAGDARAVEILAVILRDEVGHVAIGNRWYRWLCARAGLPPHATAQRLAREHAAPRLRPPYNLEARRAAGFDEDELAALDAAAPPPQPAGD
ncbi:ferritin-like domain-containing protein [Piscinibacter sakaiensis]|uniref:COG2833 family protein n=1 Tax=Piscinibacter sakaiensis TaxID=1547922 RepID=A0A0K8NZM3_PISS1|nr:ferritin-like domain-containing protein [Piscinibacter sakaiensis]GAP35734.1 COG2833 family protein [Piscinibacter sakaiensis]